MTAQLIERNGREVIIQITINLAGTMLQAEDRIQDACNAAGMLATAEVLKGFNTDGSPILMGGIKWTKRSASPKKYQTPYGEVKIERNVYL